MVAILSRMINTKYYKMMLVQRKITIMMLIYICKNLIHNNRFIYLTSL